MNSLLVSHAPPAAPNRVLDPDLRADLETNSDLVLHITKPMSMDHIPALIGQADQPVLFEKIIEERIQQGLPFPRVALYAPITHGSPLASRKTPSLMVAGQWKSTSEDGPRW